MRSLIGKNAVIFSDDFVLFFKKTILILQEAIFSKEWICVGRKDQVDEPGKYFSGCVTQNPFIVVNDDSQIKAFFNVCRHHAAQIVENDSEGCTQRYSKVVHNHLFFVHSTYYNYYYIIYFDLGPNHL